MDLALRGKCAAITGGSRGLGFATARAFAEEGARVAICARDSDRLTSAVECLRQADLDVHGTVVDVTDTRALASWLDSVADSLGGLDILIPNASAMATTSDDAGWRASFETDLLHAVHGCDAATRYLAAGDGGSIVLVGSVAAIQAEQGDDARAYGAIKAALICLGGQLAHTYAPLRIRVNTVLPGAVDLPGGYWDSVQRDDPDRSERAKAAHALGRFATAREIAAAIVFLASPAASFITGATLRVDGGLVKTVQY